MEEKNTTRAAASAVERLGFEGIPRGCEITPYAPDEDGLLY